ncbi:MAG: hypothetical protein NTX45_22805 [Proteobacteria bacterium]|nr:hypothetical protein [Pseudomonadota bacterium]
MLIEAVMENGQVRLLKPVQFVHDSFAVKVVIPDDEIAFAYQAVTQQNQIDQQNGEVAMLKQLSNALFDDGYCYIPEKSDQEILGEVLCEKYAR